MVAVIGDIGFLVEIMIASILLDSEVAKHGAPGCLLTSFVL